MPRSVPIRSEHQTSPLDDRIELLRSLADPTRLRLLVLIHRGAEVCVCYLHDALCLPQPTVSRHLAVLRKSRLVATRRDGLWVHYRAATLSNVADVAVLSAVLDGLERMEPFRSDGQRLDRLRHPALESPICCEADVEPVTLPSPSSRARG